MNSLAGVYKQHMSNKLQYVGMRLTTIIAFSLFLSACCDTVTEVVSVDEIYWSAFRNPESFDADKGALVKDSRTANCLHRLSDRAFNSESNKLLECGLILQGTLPWNDCHDEADAFHNQGVILNDIARAIDGPVRFDETEGYGYLILSKSVVNDADWNILINTLQEAAPEFKCEYEGDCEYFWE